MHASEAIAKVPMKKKAKDRRGIFRRDCSVSSEDLTPSPIINRCHIPVKKHDHTIDDYTNVSDNFINPRLP
jgi:hypothetical protein